MSERQLILIVDDKPRNLFALGRTLAELDVSVVEARSGNEALAATLAHEFALAIVDVQMPEMDGIELAELMHGDQRTKHLPVIFLTAAYGAEEKVFRGYEAGAVDYIIKPYNEAVLLAKVHVFLELDRQRKELEQHQRQQEDLARARTGELDGLLAAMRAVLTEDQFAASAKAIFDNCLLLVGAAAGYVALLSEDGAASDVILSALDGPSRLADNPARISVQGPLADVYRQGVVVYQNDVSAGRWVGQLPVGHAALDNAMLAPLAVEGKVVGVLALANKAGGFTDEDARLAHSFGEVAAIAWRNARTSAARKTAEEALQQSEKKYRDLVENALIGVYQTNLEGDILYVNETAVKMLDFDSAKEMAAGGAVMKYKNPNDRQVLLEGLRNTGRIGSFEFEALTKTGKTKSLLLSAALANGVLTGMVLDITERKTAEERIKRVAADLERSNRELEQFAYVASHDLQEPLRMVSSYTQLLAQRYEGRLDEKARKYIDYAVDGAVRMQRLINDLLAYSRAGRPGKALEPVDTRAALGDAVRNLAATIEENRALVTSDELPTVRANASLLVQLLQNLIANAIKFHRAEPPRVHVSAREDEGQWVFSVRDNGIGIERQYADRVFVIFQRLHAKQEYPGTGIGLALCKRIVERHGGRIWFESEPGNGATFFFTVPK